MNTDDLAIIDEKIEKLIQEENDHNFVILKEKIEAILKDSSIFLVEDKLDTKAVDLYLKKVITKRNSIKKQKEKTIIDNSKETKLALIEAICKKYEFNTQEELIKKIDELQIKSNSELYEINNSM